LSDGAARAERLQEIRLPNLDDFTDVEDRRAEGGPAAAGLRSVSGVDRGTSNRRARM